MENRGLIALQGPESAKVLQALTSVDLSKMAFMTGETSVIAGFGDCRITRCGYVYSAFVKRMNFVFNILNLQSSCK